MAITCPHALGLAVPTAMSAQHGLFPGPAAFERARGLQAIVHYKPGTLAEGRCGVTDVASFGGYAQREWLRLAAALESQSEHAIAAGIVEHVRKQGVEIKTPGVALGAVA